MTSATTIEAVYPLSPMQQGMLFHSLRAPDAMYYVVQTKCTLPGNLDVDAFRRAWQRLVSRHPVLRTAFSTAGRMSQTVLRGVSVPLAIEDWRRLSDGEREERMVAWLRAGRELSLDLSTTPLMQLHLAHAGDSYEFLWSYHHALLDGWSTALLLRELVSYYRAFCAGTDLDLPAPRPYRDYVDWLLRQDRAAAEAYWKELLNGFAEPTPLPFAARSGTQRSHGRSERSIALTPAEMDALRTAARRHRVTLNVMVQGAYALLLGEHEIGRAHV